MYDAVADQRSRLTFLVYLNDDFEGGYTTFYTPGPMAGRLEARHIAPRAGSVLVFPHGGDCGSLVHEGSTVERGAKYVIRTDVRHWHSKVVVMGPSWCHLCPLRGPLGSLRPMAFGSVVYE